MVDDSKYANGNAIWSYIWKINMALLPFLVGLMTWLVAGQQRLENKTIQLESQHPIMQAEIREWTRDNFPPDDMKSDIKQIQKAIQEIKIEIVKMS